MARDLSAEPLALEEVKKHLGIRGDFRDGEISRQMVAARRAIEKWTGRAMVAREFTDLLPAFPADRIGFEYGPVTKVKEVRYVGGEGAAAIEPAPRAFGPLGNRWWMYPAAAWPAGGRLVEVVYEAGFGEGEVPEELLQAMLLLVGTWFENHESDVVGRSVVELPHGVAAICRDFRPSGII